MKMVLAIINYDDAQDVISSLMKAGFSITKLATTGGFLKAGNVTILVGLDESRLDECFDIIREHSSTRKQIIPTTAEHEYGRAADIDLNRGGREKAHTQLGVERFEKL